MSFILQQLRRRTVLVLISAVALLQLVATGCEVTVGDEEENKRFDKERATSLAKPYAAPAFEGELLKQRSKEDLGDKTSLSDLRDMPLVLNFWASWCPPCRTEQPDFVSIADKYQGKVRFLGIDFRDNTVPAEKFRRDYKLNYESIYDPSGRIGFKYGVRALPATFFITKDGKVIDRKLGGIEKKEIEDGVKRLLGEPVKG